MRGGSFDRLDRLYFPLNELVLKKVEQRGDNGDIKLSSQAKDGREEKAGWVRFEDFNRKDKDRLYSWFKKQIGKDMETIYESEWK